MKINSLILAFPVLCLACNSPSTPGDPASQMEASPIHARQVTGVRELTVDFNYDDPCNILGEEYIRTMFSVPLTTEFEEIQADNGCAFEWSGNKVAVTFGGRKPFSSIYQAESIFDHLYQMKPVPKMTTPIEETTETTNSGPETEGSGAETSAADSTHQNTDDKQPNHSGVSAATPPLTKPAVSQGNYKAVPQLGDKAVWNETTGAMHVLYNNHIISVTVETKGQSEAKKKQAESLAEVLIEKISANEYVKRL